jgi:hypothetical protein
VVARFSRHRVIPEEREHKDARARTYVAQLLPGIRGTAIPELLGLRDLLAEALARDVESAEVARRGVAQHDAQVVGLGR